MSRRVQGHSFALGGSPQRHCTESPTPNQALQRTTGAALVFDFDGSTAPVAAELGRSAAEAFPEVGPMSGDDDARNLWRILSAEEYPNADPTWRCLKCGDSPTNDQSVCPKCGTSKQEVMMIYVVAKAQSLMEAENVAEALPVLQEWERLAEQNGDQRSLAGCLCRQGEAQAWTGNPGVARQLFQRAQAIYAAIGNPGLMAIAISHEANLTRHEYRDLRSASSLYERALGAAQSAGRPDLGLGTK